MSQVKYIKLLTPVLCHRKPSGILLYLPCKWQIIEGIVLYCIVFIYFYK